MAKKVLIAVSCRLYREGLRKLMADQVQVIGEAPDGATAVKLAKELHPDLVVMEVQHEVDSIEATRQIAQEEPGIRVLGISDSGDWRTATRMLQAGASGYVLSDDGFGELPRAIPTVLAGHTFMSAGVETAVIKAYIGGLSTKQADDILTTRERQVLQLLAEGNTMKQVAGVLFISVKTVETHRKHIMEKLGRDEEGNRAKPKLPSSKASLAVCINFVMLQRMPLC